ncbi:hypothetical protein ABZT03_20905 [Streptomyces sp. NPDC005574]|uniref:hypothetical protein n=1 Tax=Streptomyces sp. NPDC005574 TaxID=3156891 RepID=UPI0033A7E8EB
MRRTVRALSVAALASVVLGFAASAALADPAAEVGPSSVSPGGSVTVSVSCDATASGAPAAIDATSQAFEHGTVQLQQVPGGDSQASALAYSGTARISPTMSRDGDADAVGRDAPWTVDGTCPAATGGKGKQWSAGFDVPRDGADQCAETAPGPCDTGKPCTGATAHSCDPGTDERCAEKSGEDCEAAVVQRGVRAGEGGSLTGSVPALVAGGLLIAGGLGAAAHRLRRRDSGPVR